MLSSHCDPEILAARPILADTLYRYGSLDDAAGVLRALGHADVRSSLPIAPMMKQQPHSRPGPS